MINKCTILIILLYAGLAYAAPSVNSPTQSVYHGGTITISGTDFGAKSPAAPLIWDDCEGKTVDSDAAVAAVWDEVHPLVSGASFESARTRYRTIPYRSTPAPHTRSKTYLSGGHHQFDDNDPAYIGGTASYRDVLVTVDSGTADKDTWFASWYYTLDPSWPSPCPNYVNHKTDIVNTGDDAWSGTPNNYTAYWTGSTSAPCATADENKLSIYNGSSGGVVGTFEDAPTVNSPRLDWIRYTRTEVSSATSGYRKIIVDNEIAAEYASGSYNPASSRSFTVGGYWRWSETSASDTSTFRGDEDAYRYFDDIYIDTTLSRVMLANDATYADATIVEPQIPSAWNSTSITATVNLGKFSDDEAVYLFVFDADGVANSVGVAVALAPESLLINGSYY